ncbi:MAG TPA: hypothetical protein VJS43_10250 [Candidatus Acidoferrales bacterium]|nr:hypothetical protein [Candidatus Acidoferrales bacterium]
MKLAKTIATALTALAIALCLAGGAPAQTKAAVHKPGPQNSTAKPAVAVPSKPSPKPAAAAPSKTMPVASARKTEAKPMTPKPVAGAKPAVAKSAKEKPASAKPSVAKSAAPEAATKNKASVGMTASPDQAPAVSHADNIVARRDPFVSLVNVQKEGGGGPNLPPGKAGLVVATVRVDGTVKSGDDLIAVVSNPERHVYFVREGDHLYDGNVKRIDLDGVTFQEDSKDAFGKPVVREVTKRIYASAGEQQ